ncbi:MAG TPA: FmdB family zinc ribbon protein [Candidatus Acidoferrales bacterium]
MYEYVCRNCQARVERIEKLNGPYLKICPKCKGRVDRIVSRSSIAFKGSGWYVTDYAKPSSAGDSGKQEAAPASAQAGSKPAAGSDKKEKTKPAPASKGKKAGGAEK